MTGGLCLTIHNINDAMVQAQKFLDLEKINVHHLDSGSNLWHCNKFGDLPRRKANAKVEAKRRDHA